VATKPSASKRLKKLAGEIPADNIIHTQLGKLEHLDGGGDYALALIGATFVERALEVAILSRLTPMDNDDRARLFDFDRHGPLCDLASRIRMARAMGIYGPHTFDDLTRIREIRNAFAHALWHITFATAEIAEMCDFYASRRVTSGKATIAGGIVPGANQRTRYMHAVRFIASALKATIQAEGVVPRFQIPTPDYRLP
jgi:hypothetical protein